MEKAHLNNLLLSPCCERLLYVPVCDFQDPPDHQVHRDRLVPKALPDPLEPPALPDPLETKVDKGTLVQQVNGESQAKQAMQAPQDLLVHRDSEENLVLQGLLVSWGLLEHQDQAAAVVNLDLEDRQDNEERQEHPAPQV